MTAVTAIARPPPIVTRNPARPRGAPLRWPPNPSRVARLTKDIGEIAGICDPNIRLSVDTIASSEPGTAARSHPERPLRCACPSCIGTGCVGPGFTSKPRTLISRVSVSLKKPDYGTPSQQLTRRVIFAQSCAGEHVIAEIRFILLCVCPLEAFIMNKDACRAQGSFTTLFPFAILRPHKM
jgi:hypothetical protein